MENVGRFELPFHIIITVLCLAASVISCGKDYAIIPKGKIPQVDSLAKEAARDLNYAQLFGLLSTKADADTPSLDNYDPPPSIVESRTIADRQANEWVTAARLALVEGVLGVVNGSYKLIQWNFVYLHEGKALLVGVKHDRLLAFAKALSETNNAEFFDGMELKFPLSGECLGIQKGEIPKDVGYAHNLRTGAITWFGVFKYQIAPVQQNKLKAYIIVTNVVDRDSGHRIVIDAIRGNIIQPTGDSERLISTFLHNYELIMN